MSEKKRYPDTRLLLAACLAVAACAALCPADVRLPAVIGDGMVLQQQKPVSIWGWADPGEAVTVELAGNKAAATADDSGRWLVKLPPVEAGNLGGMTVTGRNSIRLKNILAGEVWVCSGQSNMQWSLNQINAKDDIAAANHRDIRLLTVPKVPSGQPVSDMEAGWQTCNPDTVAEFSAVGYFFGRELQAKLKVPIGLIDSSWGGTRIEPWTPPLGFVSVPELAGIRAEVERANELYRNAVGENIGRIEQWVENTRACLDAGISLPPLPVWPKHELDSHRKPTGIYNGMIYPLLPFAIRGAIWYQGESNLDDGAVYYYKMKALINGWRKVWGLGDFPFYYVQLAPFRYNRDDKTLLPQLWEAQTKALSIENTGMAVTTDIGDLDNIHPKNKQDLGRRLSLWALADTYGYDDLVFSGPMYKRISVQTDRIRIHFDHVGGGLVSRDGKPLNWFTIAGEDRNFVEAEASIDGDTVVVRSGKVARPVAVRFAWHEEAEPNLANAELLPAVPFRTDDWPVAKANR